MDDGLGLNTLDQLLQLRIVARHVEIVILDLAPGHFFPCPQSRLDRLDRGQRLAAQLHVDLTPGKIVDDDHVIAFVR